MTEELIIDIQGFVGLNNQFVPKEVAVLSVRHQYTDFWVIAPPFSFSELGSNARRQNNWLSRHFHQLTWEEGQTPFKSLPSLLAKATSNASTVYVRGQEKTRYLQNILSTPIVNLESITPAFKQLLDNEHYCLFHGVTACELYTGAVQNVHKLKSWLVTEESQNKIRLEQLSTIKLEPRDSYILRQVTGNEFSSDEEEFEISFDVCGQGEQMKPCKESSV